MHMSVLTTRHGRMLLEDKETLTLTEAEGVCYSSVPPTDCAYSLFSEQENSQVQHTWYRDSVEQRSIIGFCIVSADLFSSQVDIRVKKGAELSTDHQLVV